MKAQFAKSGSWITSVEEPVATEAKDDDYHNF